jgi:hypothetical protein
LNSANYPNFLCPNCRAVADLEADVEEADSEWDDGLDEAIEASKKDSNADVHAQSGTDADGDSEMIDSAGLGTTRHEAGTDTNGQLPIDEDSIALESHNNQPSHPVGPAPPVPVPIATSTLTPPRPIPPRKSSPGRYELVPGQTVADGPMTPRNDAGPFVLDGGAGQSSTNRDRGSTISVTNPPQDDERA